MLRLKTVVLLIALLAVSACGYVEGNYPEPKVKPPELPTTWNNAQGEELPVVWDRAPQSRGFFARWVDMEQMGTMIKAGVEMGDRRAMAVADEFKSIDDEGLVNFTVALFMAKGTKIRVVKGRVAVEFSDGTRTQDEGVAFMEDHKKGPRLHTTRSSAQTIESKYAETGKPLYISVTVPAKYAGRTVRSVRVP